MRKRDSSRQRNLGRREFLRTGFKGFSAFLGAALIPACGGGSGGAGGPQSNIGNLGALQAPDANGVMLPPGFTSRIVAYSRIAPTGGYVWHDAPDGGAVYPVPGGGWIYVSNSELGSGNGGVGALKFNAAGNVVDAYSICSNTSRNCAGGKTPWGTWLTCEENGGSGEVYECDPFSPGNGTVLPALGSFNHEAVAVDPVRRHLYLTEDAGSGSFYRFTPTSYPNLTSGTLEVAEVTGGGPEGPVIWNPLGGTATPFNGGEGIDYFNGLVYFVTKGDNRVWCYNTNTTQLTILYDDNNFSPAPLTGVDNVVISPGGDVLVAEDGGNQEIVAITPSGTPVKVLGLSGHGSSEITGPAFSPDFSRLYFSSQRGTTGASNGGITFEVSGPFTT